jgi:hypothetical protein
MKSFHMQYALFFYGFLPLRYKYCPKHQFSKASAPCYSLRATNQISPPHHINYRLKNVSVYLVPSLTQRKHSILYRSGLTIGKNLKKVTLSLSEPRRRIWGVDVIFHPFFTSALNGSERPAVRPDVWSLFSR